MKRVIKAISFAILALLGIFTATAFAANAVNPDDQNIFELLKPVYEAFMRGEKLYAGMLALVAAVAAAKRYAPGRVGAWINGKYGQPLTVLLMSFGGAMATALSAGSMPGWPMVKTAALIAAAAAGGYSMIKTLLVDPFIRPWAAKAPAWLRWLLNGVLWFFDRPSPVAKAEAAGQAAVDAKPAQGTEGVVGKAREVE